MSDPQVQRELDIQAELGEHPLWSARDECLYWLDIQKSTINRFDPRKRINSVWELPTRPGCFAFCEEGGAIVAAQDGIYMMDFSSGIAQRIVRSEHDPQAFRFNDGKTDRQGRLWIGTVRADEQIFNTADNAYYRFDGKTLDRVLTGVGMTNGTAFSPDGRTMYRAQTETRQIFAHDYDTASGTPSNARVFAVVPAEYGLPDGATVDSDGGYWVALAQPPDGGPVGGIARYTRDGTLDLHIEVPVPLVTMAAFGDADLATLYLTTARLQAFMPYQVPDAAGSLFAIKTRFRGTPEIPFRQR